jgi:hypothetical protein
LHKNYAGIGYTWDGTGFAPPQPFASWTKSAETYLWEAPTPMPTTGMYKWDEPTLSWVEVTQEAAITAATTVQELIAVVAPVNVG